MRNKLQEYRSIKSEIKLLDAQIMEHKAEATQQVSDTVRGSSADYPYTAHTMVMSGYGDNPRLARRIHKLEQDKAKLEDDRDSIEDYVRSIPNSFVRQVVTWYYIKGNEALTWQQVANRIGGRNTADGLRKVVDRHFA